MRQKADAPDNMLPHQKSKYGGVCEGQEAREVL